MAMNSGRTSRYQWSEVNVNGTLMGRYLTRVECGLIEQAFDEFGWPKIVLDIGGGDGRLVKPLRAKGVWPVTLERDSVPLAELKESGWNYPLLMGDGNLLPIRGDSVDAVMAFEVAPCTNASHNAGFFKEVYRVLHNDGIFLFSSDNTNSLIGLLSKFTENKSK
jgi:SAM-dependent methyltransferase